MGRRPCLWNYSHCMSGASPGASRAVRHGLRRVADVLMTNAQTIGKTLQWFALADADVVLYAARVTVWGRWFVWLFGAVTLAYRPGLWYPDDFAYVLLNVMLAGLNGALHYRLLTNRPVTWRWMLALSAMDIVLITANIAISGRFDNYIFIAYYPALGAFAVIFTSFRLNMVWVTATAGAHSALSVGVGSGLDLAAGDERVLAARVAGMYLIAVGINLIVRFERIRRRAAMARERQLQRERIELSQAIHDTTAQTAYVIGLGIEGAIKLAGDSHPKLAERLAATAALSRSAMWELRRPIDMGSIFEGRQLARVLGSHTATFARITAVPAEMVQSGDEPELPTEVRTGLFSIAHNALANAFLHARAGRVEVGLDFEAYDIRLSVSDDGVGLPEDYAERGRGFGGMETDAERMGGKLIVESGGPDGGTTITCVVPRKSSGRGG